MDPLQIGPLQSEPYTRYERRVHFSLNNEKQKEHYAFQQNVDLHLLSRIIDDLQCCDAYKKMNKIPQVLYPTHWRNIYGHCTHFMAGTKELFCSCCKFQTPRTVVETTIASYFLPFYDPEMYRGISIDHLVNVDLLEGLGDEYTVKDFCEQRYTWTQLISRHYSRMHWRAVRAEQERFLLDWIDFMRQINSSSDLELKEAQRNLMFNILLPELPPTPTDGAFLCRKTMESEMRDAITLQVQRHYEDCEIKIFNRPFSFPLCEITEVWLLHEPKAHKTPIEYFIDQTVHKPERIRRIVNACRNWFEEPLNLISYPTTLNSMTFMNEPIVNSYIPSNCDLQFAHYLLDQKQDAIHKTFWFRYEGGIESITYNKYFMCNDFFLMELLQNLFNEYPFENVCNVDVSWVSSDKQDAFFCGKSVYGISYPCTGEKANQEVTSILEFFTENCVCERVRFNVMSFPTPQQFFSTGYMNIIVSHENMDILW